MQYQDSYGGSPNMDMTRRRILIVLLFLCLLCSPFIVALFTKSKGSQLSRIEHADALVQQANDSKDHGKNSLAIELYKQAINEYEKSGDDTRTQILAECYHQLFHLDESKPDSVKLIEKAIQLYGQTPDAETLSRCRGDLTYWRRQNPDVPYENQNLASTKNADNKNRKPVRTRQPTVYDLMH